MPRVKLEEQPEYAFSHTVTVRVTDLNYGSHLANSALVELLHEARARLFHQLGCSEVDLGDGHTGIIMADLAINFKAEGFLFETLRIDSHIAELGRKSFRIFQRVRKEEGLVALAETGIVTFDYRVRSPAVVPETFVLALQSYLKREEIER